MTAWGLLTTRIPQQPRRQGGLRRLVWVVYVAAIIAVIWGPLLLDGVRAATGSIPPAQAPAAVGWAMAWLVTVAVASGTAGGPWIPSAAVATLVLPSRHGTAVLARTTLRLFGAATTAGAFGGAVLTLGFETQDVDTRVVAGAIGGGTLALSATALAVAVQPLTRLARVRSVAILAALAVAASSDGLAGRSTSVLGQAVAGEVTASGRLVVDVMLALAAAAIAMTGIGEVRVGRVIDRAHATRSLAVVLTNQDLRSMQVVARALAGDRSRSTVAPLTARWAARLGPVTRRHVQALRRSGGRRLVRLALLVAVATWGWWLLSVGALLGLVAIGVANWLIVLELAEPLGQELDRPMLVPTSTVRHRRRHLAATIVVAAPVLALPALFLAPALGGTVVISAVVAVGIPSVIAAGAAAANALLRSPVDHATTSFVNPESFAAGVVTRESLPPLLALSGMAALVAPAWLGDPAAALRPGTIGSVLALVVTALVIALNTARERRTERKTRRTMEHIS